MARRLSKMLGDRREQMPGGALGFSKQRLQKHLGAFRLLAPPACLPYQGASRHPRDPAVMVPGWSKTEWRGWPMVSMAASPS